MPTAASWQWTLFSRPSASTSLVWAAAAGSADCCCVAWSCTAKNIQLLASLEGSSYGARILSRLQPADLLIAIAYPRYFADTVLLARRARDAGVPVLVLTDRVTSPLAPLATVSLYAHTDSQYFANSEASALALIEALCSAVAHRAKDSLKAATQLAEAVLPWLHGSHAGRLRASVDAAASASAKRRIVSKSSKVSP